MRAFLLAGPALALALALALAPRLALAQQTQGGLTFAQARAEMPGLSRVTFDKFDPDGDGVIAPNKVPALQATYNVMYLDRG